MPRSSKAYLYMQCVNLYFYVIYIYIYVYMHVHIYIYYNYIYIYVYTCIVFLKVVWLLWEKNHGKDVFWLLVPDWGWWSPVFQEILVKGICHRFYSPSLHRSAVTKNLMYVYVCHVAGNEDIMQIRATNNKKVPHVSNLVCGSHTGFQNVPYRIPPNNMYGCNKSI